MAQHDFNIANQGFPATRADINNAFQAIASNSSGATAPSTTYANMWWYDTTNNKMYLRNEADSAWIEVATIDQTNNEWQITTGQISAVDGDGISFKTDDGTTRVTLDDSGNLLVGTTDVDPSNDTSGSGISLAATGYISAARASAATLNVNRTGSDGDIAKFNKNGTTVGSIGVTSSRMFTGTGDTGLFFNDSLNSIDPWDTSTNAARDGAIDLGDGSRRFKDLYLSGGVYLGGTGAANKLDDYEEGSWTPTAYQGTTTTYINQTGTYVKIGKLVYIMGRLTINNLGDGSAQRIGGLPFTQDSNEHTFSISKLSGGAGNFYSFHLRTSGSTLYASVQTGLDSTLTTNVNYLANGTEIQFSGVYEVA